MRFTEMEDNAVWKVVYEEGWKMWKEGLDRLRKSENGLEAARAKQMMEDAERVLRTPLRSSSEREDVVRRGEYRKKLAKNEENLVRGIFQGNLKGV